MTGRYENGLTTLFGLMKPNQAIFVHHLRTNPNNVTQITGSLVDDNHTTMCALGLGLEAFGMIKAYEEKIAAPSHSPGSFTDFPVYDPYAEIAAVLEMPKSHVEQVYALNDDHELTFRQIADIMETYFRQGNLASWTAKGPEDIYAESKREETDKRRDEFLKVWETYREKYSAFLTEAAAALGTDKYALGADGVFESYDGGDFFDEVVNEDSEW